ncbi:PilZ domain-containing protein [Consotaella aegiceratis]|uniref:PilZ domain-containing protein n=1 Tax=Consotaella aegiceratis TaxID=3097961 RepID=UPI002F3FD246
MAVLPDWEPDDSERRAAPRTRMLKRAKILFNNHFSTYDCIVRNISATGALLTLDEAVHLPKTFELRIGDDKQARPAQLVYRRGMFAGIRFLDVETQSELPIDRAPPPPVSAPEPAVSARSVPTSGSVRRIVPDDLPFAIARNFRWS